MRANEDIRKTPFHIVQTFLLLFWCTETGQQFNFHGIVRHSLAERIIMLLCQNRRGHKECHLLAFLRCLECCTDGYFCFAVTNVAADESVHDLGAFHIFFYIFNGVQLVIGFFEGEVFLKFLLPYSIFAIFITFCCCTLRIQGNQIFRHDLYGFSGFGFRLRPVLTAQFIQFRHSRASTDIFLHHIHLVDRHKKAAAIPIGNFHIIFLDTIHRNFLQTAEHTDPMIIMYHVIANVQVCETFNGRTIFLTFFLSLFFLAAKEFTVAEYRQIDEIITEALCQCSFRHPDSTFRHFSFQVFDINRFQPHICQFPCNTLGAGTAACQDQSAEIFFFQILQFLYKKVCSLLERRCGTYRKIHQNFRAEINGSLAQSCKKDCCKTLHLMENIIIVIKHMALTGQQISLLDTAFYRLLIFLHEDVHMLPNPLRFINTKDRIFRKVRKEADCFIIKIIYIHPYSGQGMFCTKQFCIFADMFSEAFCRFFQPLLLQISQHFSIFFQNTVCGFHRLFFRIDHFSERKNLRFLQPVNGTLALGIHTADRVDFIIPEIDTDSVFCRQRPDIQNTAALRKLTGAFHQFCSFITHYHQFSGQVCHFCHIAFLQLQQERFEHIFFRILIQKGFHRSYDNRGLSLHQAFQNKESLTVHFHAMHIGTVKKDIFGRIIDAILFKEGHPFQNFFRAQFAVGQNKDRSACLFF